MGNVIKGLSGMLKFDPSINHIKKVTTRINTKTEGMDIEKMKAYLESPEGKASMEEYFGNLAKKQRIKEGRFLKFDKWLEDNDFDKLLYRLILEHDDEYIDNCYHKGYQPYPTRKMQFVFDYVTEYAGTTVEIEEFECSFPHQEWEFKGYYFGIMWGQGAVISIWNKDDKRKIFGI